MTFDSRERSADLGEKTFVYTWNRGARFYRYAAADEDLLLDFQTYLASSVSHGAIEQGSEPVRANITVTVPMDHPVAMLYRSFPPVDSIVLTIQEFHVGEEDDRRAVWSGRITGVKWRPEEGLAEINHEPSYTSLKRTGLRRMYQRHCPLVLYGKRCGANPEAFAITTAAAEVEGSTVTAAAFIGANSTHWAGGFIVYEIESGVEERRFIRGEDVDGDTLTLSAPASGLLPGMMLKAYPGCDHSLDTCIDFFDNGDNNGGFPNIPYKNPFGQEPIY